MRVPSGLGALGHSARERAPLECSPPMRLPPPCRPAAAAWLQVKAEIQALSSFGFQYLSQQYLPLKLQEGDWI